MNFATRAARYFLLAVIVIAITCLTSCKQETPAGTGTAPAAGGGPPPVETKWHIGFSQCTTTEPWRVLFNELLQKEADRHPEVQLEILDALDKIEEQNAQMEAFINKGVDAILISPKESAGLTDVVERATDAGIPVIVLDRDVDTDKYACFVGGNNKEIGQEAGKFAVEALGGEGKAKGKIYEIWGGRGSTPAIERHDGFAEIVKREPGITLVGEQDGDWKQERGYEVMEAVLKTEKDIDIVYAHNDPMAYGAYLAAQDAGREQEIKFVGIDANPDEGCKWAREGMLAATFVYPPPGEKGLQMALAILEGGEPEAQRIFLPTRRITKDTVDDYLREKGLLEE